MVEEKKKKVEPKVKVVTLDEYIGKVGTNIGGPAKVKAALVLLYSENKVIATAERKGITYFIAEK